MKTYEETYQKLNTLLQEYSNEEHCVSNPMCSYKWGELLQFIHHSVDAIDPLKVIINLYSERFKECEKQNSLKNEKLFDYDQLYRFALFKSKEKGMGDLFSNLSPAESGFFDPKGSNLGIRHWKGKPIKNFKLNLEDNLN